MLPATSSRQSAAGGNSSSPRQSGLSRLSSAAAADSLNGLESFQNNDRQEARRRLGNTGKVFLDVGSDDDEEEACNGEADVPSPLLQLQQPAGDGCARRVTFSTAGASAEEPQLQPGTEVGTSAMLHASRLWRGAAASLFAGRLQSVERHAADLKQRQEVHTELRAWVDQVLSQRQDEQQQLQLPHEDSSDSTGWHATHSDTQHQHQHDHQQSPEQGATGAQESGASQPDAQHRRRSSRHSHRHRRHHQHHHAAAEQLEGAAQQGDGSDEAGAVAAAAVAGVAADGLQPVTQQAEVPETMAVLSVQQGPEQWHQFNAAEQQLITQMQQEQQQLLEQLQQAYTQIAALTAAQTATAAAAAAGPGPFQHTNASSSVQDGQQQEQADVFLQPAADTQVLVLARHSTSSVVEMGVGQTGSCMQEASSRRQQSQVQEDAPQQQQQQQQANAVQPAAPASARRTSTSSSPRAKLASKAAAPSQPSAGSSSPRTPRAAGKAQKAAVTTAAGGRQPASADASAAAKGKSRQNLPIPQGRGLTLPQQQALVQRLQEAEGVMGLLQQDLQASLAAQQQLEEQLQQLGGTGRADRQPLPGEASLQPSAAQGLATLQEAGEVGAGGGEPCRGGDSSEGVVLALRQQLQEQVQLTSQAQQELADANKAVSAQQQKVAELQAQLQQQSVQDQQPMQALQQQLAGAQEQLQALQLQQQTASTPADCQQQGQQGLLPQPHESAPGASQEPVCCQHEARCQQLQSILQALLQQRTAPPAAALLSGMRPHTAAAQRSPRARSTWQHRPVGLHTLLYPPLAAQLQPAAAQGYPWSVSAPRCATASSSSPRHKSRAAAGGAVRCNTSDALTATCSSSSAAAGRLQDGVLVPTDGRLRPLTYRGPDRDTADVSGAATSARRLLSADVEQGLLASLRVAPVSARTQRGTLNASRGCAEDSATPGLGGRGPTQQQFSPRRQDRADAAAGAQAAGYSAPCVSPRRGGGSLLQGSVRRGVPKLALSGLY